MNKLNFLAEQFNSEIEKYLSLKTRIEDYLSDDIIHTELDDFTKAMEYSYIGSGKRLRPILLLESFNMFSGHNNSELLESVKTFAYAIECIHTYSLIHDDLPAMDNDDLRRGRPTNHVVYGEAVAILAGDALLNYAYELMLDEMMKTDDEIFRFNMLRASRLIAKSSGIDGMLGGQVLDIAASDENAKILNCKSEVLISKINEKKTGELIRASLMAGAILSGANNNDLNNIETYAINIGKAFQITDDILDVIGDEKEFGKPIGSDSKNTKLSSVKLYGLEGAQKMAEDYINCAKESIREYGEKAEFLSQLADYILSRKK